MGRNCAVCGDKLDFLDSKIKTKDKKYICENCYKEVFKNYSVFDLTNWEQAHNFDEFMTLLNDGEVIDLRKEKRNKKDKAKVEKEKMNANIARTKEKFRNHDALLFDRLSFDPVDKEIMQPKTFTKPFEVIPYSDIVGYTPIERGHSKNKKHGITRAVVGGVLAGGVGSIVGAGTGGKQFEYTDKLGVNIALKDGRFLEALFIKQETKQGMMVKAAYDNFYRICSLLDGIIAENGHETSQKVELANPNDSLAKQIRDLKELVDDEIITEEEFETKKKQLLEA